jgi:signal transduction histidine kinase
MLLQRQRLAASHVADRRVRRVLHDDVLPQIHTAMIMLQSLPAGERQSAAVQGGAAHTPDITATLADAHRQIADLLHDLPTPGSDDLARLGLIEALRGVVLRELASAFDQVEWKIEPEAERCARALGPLAAEVVFYAAREAIRNAARHARGGDPGRALRLTIAAGWEQGGPATPGLALTIEDDGVGMATAVPAVGGSGRGLALHSTMLAVVGGTLTTESRPGAYTRVRLTLPATSAGEAA